MDVAFPLLVFSSIGVMVIMLCARTLEESERRAVANLLLAGFALRMASASAFALFPALRIFHEDAEGYEYVGMRIAEGWAGRGPPMDEFVQRGLTQNYGYPYVTAAVYYLTGPFRVSASYLNCIVGTTTAFFVYTLARRFVIATVAVRTLALLVFMPSMISWSALALKEPVVTFFIVLAMIFCVKLKQRFSMSSVIGIAVSIAAIQPLRFYLIYFIAFAVLGSLVLDRGMRALTGVYKQLFLAALGIGLFAVLGLAGSAQQGAEGVDFEYLNQFRRGMATTANSGFSKDVDISTPGKALAFLPVAIPTFLLAPFPWQMTSLRPLIAAPETVLWWFLFPGTLRGLQFMIRRRFGRVSPVLLFTVALTGLYSLMHGNVGSAFRQRAQIFVFLFIFTALGSYMAKCQAAGIDPDVLLNRDPGDDEEVPLTLPADGAANADFAPSPRLSHVADRG